MCTLLILFFFFSSRRRHTRFDCDWSSDVCSSDLAGQQVLRLALGGAGRLAHIASGLQWLAVALQRRGNRGLVSAHQPDRKSTRLNSSHSQISYAVFCLKKKKKNNRSSTCIA